MDKLNNEGKKKKKKLEKEVVELRKELADLDAEKAKFDQATKRSYKDSFFLAHYQVLSRFPDLDLSFLAALDIPERPSWQWSRAEFLNLPAIPPSAPRAAATERDSGGEDAEDAEK